MIAEASILMKYLPPSLGIFLVVVAAGLMGLFRSMALNKKSYDDTVSSLQRQIEVLMAENAILRRNNRDDKVIAGKGSED
jgi:cell division protein FtsB